MLESIDTYTALGIDHGLSEGWLIQKTGLIYINITSAEELLTFTFLLARCCVITKAAASSSKMQHITFSTFSMSWVVHQPYQRNQTCFEFIRSFFLSFGAMPWVFIQLACNRYTFYTNLSSCAIINGQIVFCKKSTLIFKSQIRSVIGATTSAVAAAGSNQLVRWRRQLLLYGQGLLRGTVVPLFWC